MGTYVNNLRLLEITTGDESGTWGTKTNTNLELIADAFGSGTEAITTNADTHTTTIADGAADEGRAIFLKYTGTLDSACTITIAPNTVNKVWLIENATSGSQNIIISQGSGANITIGNGKIAAVLTDGAGGGAAVLDAFADLELSSTLTVAGNVDFNGALDVDGTANLDVVDIDGAVDMATTLTLAGNADFNGDLDVDGTTNLDVVDIDGAVDMATTALVTGVLTTTATQVATGGITSGSTIISDTDSTDSLGSTGVRWLKGWFDTLTAGTLTIGSGSVTDSSGAITFGNENLTTTGIVTAAGTSVFTNLDISGDVDVDGTTNLDVVDIDGAVDMASTLQVDGTGTFSSNVSVTVADNSAALQLICTDADASAGPLMLLDRDTASPADGDAIGRIYSQGRNDADQLVTYSMITTKSIDVTDGTEDGEMLFNVITNGAATTVLDLYGPRSVMTTTTFDLNGALDVSGTSLLTGAVTTGADITIPATNKIYLDGGGNTFINESSADAVQVTVGGTAGYEFSGVANPAFKIMGAAGGATATVNYYEGGDYFWQHGVRGADEKWYLTGNATLHSTYALMVSGQDVTVGGALAKGSGSFKIDHPLPSMKDTHSLVHSFMESPRADLQYRGSVTLANGSASVDLDESVGMTDGTWELLCRDPQVFLQNESGWSALKGSVSGSTLIITCKDTTSFDTVSWLVVAERQDEHMMETSWTDSDGRPILEPLKPEDVEDGD